MTSYDDDDPGEVETGLVTAVVTPIAANTRAPRPPDAAVTPVPLSPTAARALQPAATQMPDGWTLHKVAALVSDVAQDMYELPYLLKKHELTAKQYEVLKKNEFFQRALEAEIITWQSANSIQKRLALQAAIASEAAMPTLAARMQSKTESLADIVGLLKLFSEMAGVTGAKAAGANQGGLGSDRIKIVINLGGKPFNRDANPGVMPTIIDNTPSS